MRDATKIIKNPRITEKASGAYALRAYAFEVAPLAGKKEVAKAVFDIYKVRPTRVNILKIPRKKVFTRGKEGVKGGGKKAIVYLKEGDKIDLV